MSGKEWWSTIVGPKLLSDLVMISILFSDFPLDNLSTSNLCT